MKTEAKPAIAVCARRLAANLEKLMARTWDKPCPAALMKSIENDMGRLIDASADSTEPRTSRVTKAATELPNTIANIKADFAQPEGLSGKVEDHSDYGVELRAFIAVVRRQYPETV